MKDVIKSPAMPAWKSLMEDFWNSDYWLGMLPSHALPAVNIRETPDSYLIDLAAPGFEKKDFNVKVQNDVLMIDAEHTAEELSEQERFTRKEFSQSSIRRTFVLPQSVNGRAIDAEYRNGMLQVKLGKRNGGKLTEHVVAVK